MVEPAVTPETRVDEEAALFFTQELDQLMAGEWPHFKAEDQFPGGFSSDDDEEEDQEKIKAQALRGDDDDDFVYEDDSKGSLLPPITHY